MPIHRLNTAYHLQRYKNNLKKRMYSIEKPCFLREVKINHILLCQLPRKGSTFAPRMPKAEQACGFDLLFIYKHFI